MKKIIISILAVIGGVFVILIVINFFNKKPPTQTTQLQTKEIVNIFQEDDWGFKIEYPKDWVYENKGNLTTNNKLKNKRVDSVFAHKLHRISHVH